jgi:hypothetical protein
MDIGIELKVASVGNELVDGSGRTFDDDTPHSPSGAMFFHEPVNGIEVVLSGT